MSELIFDFETISPNGTEIRFLKNRSPFIDNSWFMFKNTKKFTYDDTSLCPIENKQDHFKDNKELFHV